MAESLSSEVNKENDTQPEHSSEVVEFSKTLSKRISNITVQLPSLSAVAVKGDDKLVERFMKETMNVKGDASQVKQSQLYIDGSNPNHQNTGSLWTPLHAAAFQEHGKVVMILLAGNAKPDLEDSEGRTAKDFASASVKIWPHFAALRYQRTPKQELVEKGIIRKVEATDGTTMPGSNRVRIASTFTRPGSAYVIENTVAGGGCAKGRLDSTAMAACLSGDVLGNSEDLGIRRRGK